MAYIKMWKTIVEYCTYLISQMTIQSIKNWLQNEELRIQSINKIRSNRVSERRILPCIIMSEQISYCSRAAAWDLHLFQTIVTDPILNELHLVSYLTTN